MLTYKTHVTIKNGAEATIEGHTDAVEAIESALVSAGFHYNNEIETWDNGFYQAPARERQAQIRARKRMLQDQQSEHWAIHDSLHGFDRDDK